MSNYPKVLAIWDFQRNDISPHKVTPNSHKRHHWSCSEGPDHKWVAVVAHVKKSIINGNKACPFCHGLKVSITNCLATINPEATRLWHPTKNGKLTPYDVVANSKQKAWFICEQGHEWYTNINNINWGSGCGSCVSSKGEKLVEEYLTKTGIKYDPQYYFDDCRSDKNGLLKFDFVVHSNSGIKLIEFQGIGHYEPVRFGGISLKKAKHRFKDAIKRDKIKYDYCEKNNIPLLEIKYDQIDDIEKLLKEFI